MTTEFEGGGGEIMALVVGPLRKELFAAALRHLPNRQQSHFLNLCQQEIMFRTLEQRVLCYHLR